VIAAVNQRKPSVRRRLEQALVDRVTVGIPTVVLYEMWYGIRKSMRPQANMEVLANFLALDVTLWPFASEDAEEAGDIRAALERAGTRIGPYDIWATKWGYTPIPNVTHCVMMMAGSVARVWRAFCDHVCTSCV